MALRILGRPYCFDIVLSSRFPLSRVFRTGGFKQLISINNITLESWSLIFRADTNMWQNRADTNMWQNTGL